ncbi:hypothetical protein SELMODRAFT_128853 [Selaginella moellendorffii]|uniref:Voltage-gated hydrogen channel 1 n=1 Tax=Selaginella moellendorffii TaxID=88036 RepID=D8SZW5_SELML|nr:hypothetical protein SELMODRAFT_128853 [Selaginella moellendorffii]
MLLKARKAGQNWRSKSSTLGSSRPSGDDHESHRDSSSNSSSSSWRHNLRGALESTPAHVTIVALLLIDLLATAVDLLLTIHNTSADLRECSASVRACQCDPTGFSSGREPWEFLHWISVGILGVLMLNVIGLMVAFGASFFKHAGYVLDLFVVTSALVLEVFFQADTAGLLIILNLWRIVRVAHGIFEVTDEAWENEIEDMKERIEGAEERFNRECGARDRRIQQLEAQLAAAKTQNLDDVL